MGKGDQRSRRGKIHRGTFGKRRPKRHVATKAAPAAEANTEPPAKRAPRVKVVEKEKEKEKEEQAPNPEE
jgi:30S ribosomal protein S31